jgi:hypothetical protein
MPIDVRSEARRGGYSQRDMGVLYKPFSIIAKLLGKRAGRAAFANVWSQVGDGKGPPASNAGYRSVVSVFFTAALQAAVLAGVGAVIDQMAARVFHQLFGAWPGKPAEPADEAFQLDRDSLSEPVPATRN